MAAIRHLSAKKEMLFMNFILILIGTALLSFSMTKHFKDTFKRPLKTKLGIALKVFGWCLLTLSFGTVEPMGINYVYWFCGLSLAVLLQAFFLLLVKGYQKKCPIKSTKTIEIEAYQYTK